MPNHREKSISLRVERSLVLFAILLTTAGCASTGIDPQWQALIDKPAWVAGELDKYPATTFLSGHGVSADLQVAKAQAMQGVTDAYFTTVSKPNENHDILDSGVALDQRQLLMNQKIGNQKKFYRDRIMPRRYIAEIWQDPSSKAFHVLSVIDRQKVAGTFQQEIERLDHQISRMMAKSEQQKDSLQRIAMTNLAIQKYQERQQLAISMKSLYPDVATNIGKWNSDQLHAQISRYVSDTTIMPVFEESNPQLQEALAGGVRSAGFNVKYGANPDYILRASFKREQIKWNDGVYTLQGNINLVLWDGQTSGQVRGKANWPIEVTAIDRNKLDQALLDAFKVSHQQNLRSAFIQFEMH